MAQFDVGETIICSCEVKNDGGTLVDPSTSMNIAINQISPVGQVAVASTAMTKDSTGKYHYDFNSSEFRSGAFQVKYIATDGTRVTIEKETFGLVD